MDTGPHPSVEELKQAIQSKGGTIACALCGREEYTAEEVDVLSGQRGYGARRRHRVQLVCENCGWVVNIDPTKLQAKGEGS